MMREYRHGEDFKSGRYGIVCPNNPEYREYVKACLTEMNTMYDFEGMFLDMTFFPEVCYCASCRERYKKETGKELPRKIDWKDPGLAGLRIPQGSVDGRVCEFRNCLCESRKAERND